MTHRDLCKLVAQWLLKQPSINLVIDEITFGTGIADVLGISTKASVKNKRIAICEVKRSRADLLADLRSQKMLKYEYTSTHCYLAATAEALGKGTPTEILQNLTEKGLPPYWGVLFIEGSNIVVLRNPRSKQKANSRSLEMLCKRIARAYMYRSFK